MSAKIRTVYFLGIALLASWLTVRTLSASTTPPVSDDPPLSLTPRSAEVDDPSLAQLIARFAQLARGQRLASR